MFRTTVEKLVEHMKNDLLLSANDSVFLHSGVKGFGLLEGGIMTILEAFRKTIPSGLLMIPTFSYSWCEGKIYDPLTTDCKAMGSFGADVWKKPGFIRSTNPNFSIATISFQGNESEIQKLYDVDDTCFGEKSVFDNIYHRSLQKPTYIMLLGGAHNDCIFRCTFVHYVEEKVKIDYRYKKNFHNPANHDEFVTQFVRYLTGEEFENEKVKEFSEFTFPITHDYTELGDDLVSKRLIDIKPFGYSQTRMVRLNTFCDFLEKELKNNPRYILKSI